MKKLLLILTALQALPLAGMGAAASGGANPCTDLIVHPHDEALRFAHKMIAANSPTPDQSTEPCKISGVPLAEVMRSIKAIREQRIYQKAVCMTTAPKTNPYKILGIPPTATEDEIDKAYKALAWQWHPNKNLDDQEGATAAMKVIEEAKCQALVNRPLIETQLQAAKEIIEHRIQDAKKIFAFLAAAFAVASVAATKSWITQLAPYQPFLQLDACGIAVPEKQIPWQRIHSMQKRNSNSTLVDIVYAKPDNVRGTLTISTKDLPCSEEQFFALLATYAQKNSTTTSPRFSTAPLTQDQLQQIRKQGFYADENAALLCQGKSDWLTLTGLSLAAYGLLAGSMFVVHALHIAKPNDILATFLRSQK